MYADVPMTCPAVYERIPILMRSPIVGLFVVFCRIVDLSTIVIYRKADEKKKKKRTRSYDLANDRTDRRETMLRSSFSPSFSSFPGSSGGPPIDREDVYI